MTVDEGIWGNNDVPVGLKHRIFHILDIKMGLMCRFCVKNLTNRVFKCKIYPDEEYGCLPPGGVQDRFPVFFPGPIGFASCGEAFVRRCRFLSQQFIITHYYHSGFSVANGDSLLVFDYWRGEEGELTGKRALTPEDLAAYAHVYVFVSHDHIDHLDPVIYTWVDHPSISYIVSSDMPVGTRGKRMAPGDRAELADGISVTAYDSTDLGVSFLVDFRGLKVFHAGDLNFWHWREESTMKEIEEAEQEFRKAVKPLHGVPVDIAFFPLDPRQGSMFEAGANFFILQVKPRILIPMHYFHRAEVAVDYARTASSRSTEVIALPRFREELTVELDDEGYLNVVLAAEQRNTEDLLYDQEEEEEEPEEAAEEPEGDEEEFELEEDDPFAESDLPLSQLSEETEKGDQPL